jgi:hypothetical protein
MLALSGLFRGLRESIKDAGAPHTAIIQVNLAGSHNASFPWFANGQIFDCEIIISLYYPVLTGSNLGWKNGKNRQIPQKKLSAGCPIS